MFTDPANKATFLNNQFERDERELDKIRAEMGPIVAGALDDDIVNNISLNHDGKLWADYNGVYTQIGEMGAKPAESLIRNLASLHGLIVNREHPDLECHIPFDGSRFSGMLPPVSERPQFSIRKHSKVIKSLDEYVTDGIMSETQCEQIKRRIEHRNNIIVCGGMNSGKTTLLNACIEHMSTTMGTEKVMILEDTQEIRCSAPNATRFLTSPERSLSDLLVSSLRYDARRYVVGEVRNAACIDMLEAWNTGHPGGLCSLHAGSKKSSSRHDKMLAPLLRIQSMCAGSIYDSKAIASIVDVIALIQLEDNKRKVTDIYTVDGYDTNYIVNSIS